MRLIDVKTHQLIDNTGGLSYAILSHTWGEQEVTFSDFVTKDWLTRDDKVEGRDKILRSCEAASIEGFNFIWIDTCCIDKSSSAELSEAINSMFRWYHKAAVCFAYLNDVESSQDPDAARSDFRTSRWFSRGWTLQELLAPYEVVFLARDWKEIGTKRTLQKPVSEITQINSQALENPDFRTFSVAQKMSWAADRRTTRPEDLAYCLMGLFDVNIPLLYGEGRRAFARLQEEILRRTADESIFAWAPDSGDAGPPNILSGLLAESPRCFKHSSAVTVMPNQSELGQFRLSSGYRDSFELAGQMFRVRPPFLGPLIGIGLSVTDAPIYSLSDVIMKGDEKPADYHSLQWFEYKFMILVPLMCAIDGQPLGLLLGYSSHSPEVNGILRRLHRPSLVSIKRFFELRSHYIIQESYVNQLSGVGRVRIRDCYVYSVQQDWSQRTLPIGYQVRVTNLLENGYLMAIEPNFRPLWRAQKKFVISSGSPPRSVIQGSLVVFISPPSTKTLPHFFVVVDLCRPRIGILGGSLPSLVRQEVWHADLSDKSSAALRTTPWNQWIVIKRRHLADVHYLSISIETHDFYPLGALSIVADEPETLDRRLQHILHSHVNS